MPHVLAHRHRLPRTPEGWVNWEELFETVPLNGTYEVCANTHLQRYSRRAIATVYYKTKLFSVLDDGTFTIDHEVVAGASRTTAARLRALLPYGCAPIWHNVRCYLKTPRGVTPLSSDHRTWSAAGRIDLFEEANNLDCIELEKKIRVYARRYVSQLFQGELIGDAGYARRHCTICEEDWQKKNPQHMLAHLNEARTPPRALLLAALRRQGTGMLVHQVIDNCTPFYLGKLRRNIRRSQRDPEKIIERTEHRLRTGKPPPVEYVKPESFRKEFERALINHLSWNLDFE